MDDSSNSVKFDSEEELRAYKDLINYVHWLASQEGVPGHWLMDKDDVEAEALITLARCMRKYLGRIPYDDFITVSMAAMRNCVGSLKYRAFLTYRKAEIEMRSLDEPVDVDCDGSTATLAESIPGGYDPAAIILSAERVCEIIAKLDGLERKVLSALLGGERRVLMYLELARARRNWIYKDPTIAITPEIIAQALCEPVASVMQAYDGIRRAVREVGA